MGRLPNLSGAQVCRLLEQHGYVKVRQRGSHVVMQKALSPSGTITVPVPQHPEIRIGTLTAIIRQSALPREVFEQA